MVIASFLAINANQKKKIIMKKKVLEITLTDRINAFDVELYLNQFQEVRKCYSVTPSCVRVYINSDKLSEKKLLKLVQQFSGTTSGRGRKKNVKSVIEITDNNGLAL
jgi:hypothetical protein